MASNRLPADVERWNGEWRHKSYQAVVNRRIINNDNLSAKEIWDKLKQVQTDPNASTYVVALVGDAFTKENYDRESKKIGESKSLKKFKLIIFYWKLLSQSNMLKLILWWRIQKRKDRELSFS